LHDSLNFTYLKPTLTPSSPTLKQAGPILFAFLLAAFACSDSTPYGGELGTHFVIATDTVAAHYPMEVFLDGKSAGFIRERSEKKPDFCGQMITAYGYTVDPGPKAVRLFVPEKVYKITVRVATNVTLSADMNIEGICSWSVVEPFE
jgi:hypothetical protein